jgi:hypothetical protein
LVLIFRPAGRKSFDFRALTYYADRTSDQIAYLALFTIGSTMRANFFVYRDMHDPWLRQLRQSPQPTMFAAMRGLRKLTGDFEVTDRMTIRPVDLYVTKGYEQHGVVLVGDAFGTSCPAAGTGSNKVFTDVERLCNGYIPKWIMSDGMAAQKIMSFYQGLGQKSLRRIFCGQGLLPSFPFTDDRLPWRVRRWARFIGQYGNGLLRPATERVPAKAITEGDPIQNVPEVATQ